MFPGANGLCTTGDIQPRVAELNPSYVDYSSSPSENDIYARGDELLAEDDDDDEDSLWKRAGDNDCNDHYVFHGKDFTEKGKQAYHQAVTSKTTNDHDYAQKKKNYHIDSQPKKDLAVELGLKELFKERGIPLKKNALMDGDKSWTKFEVWGTDDPDHKDIENKQTVMEIWVSVKHKAMVRKRAYKNVESLYKKGFPMNDRIAISEFMWQCWKAAVADAKKDCNIDVKESDLQNGFVTNVQNPEAEKILTQVHKDVANGKNVFKIPSDDPAYTALMYASAGHGLVYMIKDHNAGDQLGGIKIKEIYLQRSDTGHDGGEPAVVFGMGH